MTKIRSKEHTPVVSLQEPAECTRLFNPNMAKNGIRAALTAALHATEERDAYRTICKGLNAVALTTNGFVTLYTVFEGAPIFTEAK